MQMKTAAIALGIAGALTLASVGSSFAGVVTTTAGVTAGPFDVTTPSSASFGDVALDGTDKVAAGSLGQSTVKDASGAGQGWKVQASGTLFTNAGGKTLPATALAVTGVTEAKVAGKDPTSTISYANGATVQVPLGAQAAGVSIYNAAAGTGMGTFSLTPALALSVPADTYAGTYTSNLTLSLVAGP